MAQPRLFLVDDHAVVRSGIRLLLEAHGGALVVGEADSGEAALERVPELAPDIVLLDLTLPGMNGIETARSLKARLPSVRLIALSMHEDPEYVRGFLEAGGNGYVPKSALETQLLDAIRAVSRGEYYAPARLLAELARDLSESGPYRHVRLTERERSVLARIAQGCTYKEIAEELGISDKTVATYRERAAEKLGLKTRAELVRYALQHGLIE
ncbi:response regulator [Truepera radiovictrix]|uniref:Two component transcriptional regulator, LuxR family n=1 Tax=Truepera radiovictrix (strain DSM 17093 / CIP 108686 / LMG 22925 / RQ-24) TaxID=649638 RepID=D7CQB6_TRURR|nr:response regulator transcription factor [Truepera radiovictrix]ADI14900.1 two component transcriptional regulator, LuxR family [Truepera radiovictrix DSM 17093]WMT56548.1 response regulator transcription factor [Truepera radiovictrix]